MNIIVLVYNGGAATYDPNTGIAEAWATTECNGIKCIREWQPKQTAKRIKEPLQRLIDKARKINLARADPK